MFPLAPYSSTHRSGKIISYKRLPAADVSNFKWEVRACVCVCNNKMVNRKLLLCLVEHLNFYLKMISIIDRKPSCSHIPRFVVCTIWRVIMMMMMRKRKFKLFPVKGMVFGVIAILWRARLSLLCAVRCSLSLSCMLIHFS